MANTLKMCVIVQELCESRGGRPGLSVLTSLLVTMLSTGCTKTVMEARWIKQYAVM